MQQCARVQRAAGLLREDDAQGQRVAVHGQKRILPCSGAVDVHVEMFGRRRYLCERPSRGRFILRQRTRLLLLQLARSRLRRAAGLRAAPAAGSAQHQAEQDETGASLVTAEWTWEDSGTGGLHGPRITIRACNKGFYRLSN